MTDIVDRLRVLQRQYESKMLPASARMHGEAADEIERLRDALNDMTAQKNHLIKVARLRAEAAEAKLKELGHD